MNDAPALVRAEGLGFAFPDHVVLRDLDFALRPGLTLVRGGDGRGKTTLLRLLAGKYRPTAGTLQRAGGPVFHETLSDAALDGVVARAWVLADYDAPEDLRELPFSCVIDLGD